MSCTGYETGGFLLFTRTCEGVEPLHIDGMALPNMYIRVFTRHCNMMDTDVGWRKDTHTPFNELFLKSLAPLIEV